MTIRGLWPKATTTGWITINTVPISIYKREWWTTFHAFSFQVKQAFKTWNATCRSWTNIASDIAIFADSIFGNILRKWTGLLTVSFKLIFIASTNRAAQLGTGSASEAIWVTVLYFEYKCLRYWFTKLIGDFYFNSILPIEIWMRSNCQVWTVELMWERKQILIYLENTKL